MLKTKSFLFPREAEGPLSRESKFESLYSEADLRAGAMTAKGQVTSCSSEPWAALPSSAEPGRERFKVIVPQGKHCAQ